MLVLYSQHLSVWKSATNSNNNHKINFWTDFINQIQTKQKLLIQPYQSQSINHNKYIYIHSKLITFVARIAQLWILILVLGVGCFVYELRFSIYLALQPIARLLFIQYPQKICTVIIVINVKHCHSLMQQFYDIYYAQTYDDKNHSKDKDKDNENNKNNNNNSNMIDYKKLCEKMTMDRVNEYNLIVYQRIKFVQNAIQGIVFAWIFYIFQFVLLAARIYVETGNISHVFFLVFFLRFSNQKTRLY